MTTSSYSSIIFVFFKNKDNDNEEDSIPVKRPRRFWVHDTLHRRQAINKFVNIKLIMAVVGYVLLCALEDRRYQDF